MFTKRILAGTVAFIMTVTMGACANKGSTAGNIPAPADTPAAADTKAAENTPAPADTQAAEAPAGGEKITLTVWESTAGPDDFIKQAGAKFTEQNPDITVNYVNVELGDSSTQIALDGPAGVGPDLFAAPHDRLGSLVADGHIAAVDSGAVQGKVLDGCLKAVTYEGKVWGYPVSTETYGLFYNKDLCPDPPKTWNDLIAFCKDFNANNAGKYGFVMDVGNAYYTILFTSSQNNMLFGPAGTDTENTLINSPASVAGMQEFHKLHEALPVASADLQTGQVDGLFQGGQAAMHITGPWNFKNFKDAGLNFGVTSLPALTGNSTPAMSFSGTRCMFVSNYSPNKEAAEKFAQFLISPEIQGLRYDITGALPSIDIAVGGEYGEYATGMLQQMKYAYPMPSIPEMGKYWDAMNSASANIWNGDGSNIQSELDAVDTAMKAQ